MHHFEVLEQRLMQWADWCVRDNDFGLGYPRKSPEAKMKDTMGIWIKPIGVQLLPCNPVAEKMDREVGELARIRPSLASAIRIQYLETGSAKQKAKILQVSYAYFRTQLELAKHWLAGRQHLK